jgi:hypothetical protein
MAVTTTANAEHPTPPVPDGGINYTMEGQCVDTESKEEGYCYGGYTVDGTFVLTFWQNGELKLIRQATSDGYVTLWTAHGFDTI